MNKLLEAAVKGINALWAEIRKRDNIIANYRQQIERYKLIHRAAPHGGDLGAGCHTGTKGTDSSAQADAFAQNDERGTGETDSSTPLRCAQNDRTGVLRP